MKGASRGVLMVEGLEPWVVVRPSVLAEVGPEGVGEYGAFPVGGRPCGRWLMYALIKRRCSSGVG